MKHIIVGMSGGVDSSVTASELLQQGYRVTGLFMKNWEEDDDEQYCAATKDLEDAKAVCDLLGIELKTINFSYEYWTRVFQLFLTEYKQGRTPNPDVLCNKEIKFKEFLQWALSLGADSIATGHYARLEHSDDQVILKKACDDNKDQSYFLHSVDQEALRYAQFPLGEMNKSEVREKARQLNLPVHAKKDSTGICFIGERRFADFLSRFLPAQSGEIRTLDERVVGQHQGAYYYTLGQRQGLGIGGQGEAWYVANKNIEKNIVYVVQGHDHPALMTQIVLTDQIHWVAGQPPVLPLKCMAKTRYRQQDQACTVSVGNQNQIQIQFDQPQWAVTPGQSIVLYQQTVCLGGGVIQQAFNPSATD